MGQSISTIPGPRGPPGVSPDTSIFVTSESLKTSLTPFVTSESLKTSLTPFVTAASLSSQLGNFTPSSVLKNQLMSCDPGSGLCSLPGGNSGLQMGTFSVKPDTKGRICLYNNGTGTYCVNDTGTVVPF